MASNEDNQALPAGVEALIGSTAAPGAESSERRSDEALAGVCVNPAMERTDFSGLAEAIARFTSHH